MRIDTVCVLGGTGFVGGHLVSRLIDQGYYVKIPSRRPMRHRELLVLPGVELVRADVHDHGELRDALQGCQAAVNLVGILNERGHDGSGFRHAHVELPRKLTEVCKEQGIGRLLHISALNADAHAGPSYYLQTKGEGEDLVHREATEDFHVSSFRPSVIFGPEDSFLNRFASLLKLSPFVFPLACPDSRFAPVYVGDVADAFIQALEDKASYGKRYDLCGPHEYTLKALVQYTARLIGARRLIWGLPDWAARTQARVLQHVPGKPFSMDNYRSLQVDSVCRNGTRCSTALEAIAPYYLGRQDHVSRLQRLRREAGYYQ